MGRMGQNPLTKSSNPSRAIEKLNSLFGFHCLAKNERLNNQIIKVLLDGEFIACFTDIANGAKSSDDLVLTINTFDKIADFILSGESSSLYRNLKTTLKTGIISKWSELTHFFKGLPSESVKQIGARLWLASSKLLLVSSDFKLLSNEWNEIFLPMEHWFSSEDGEAVEVCLNKWTSLITFVFSKSSADNCNKLNKLIPMFSKPLRSRTIINKLTSEASVFEGYLALIIVFKDVLDEHFEELIICFLRFLAGRPAVVVTATEDIQDKLKRAIHPKSTDLILIYNTSSHLDYLVDNRPYRSFDESVPRILPLICSVLGVPHDGNTKDVPICGDNPSITQKYAIFLGQMIRLAGSADGCELSTICSCFAVLADRIGRIEETAIRQSQLKLLFLQIKAWICENYFNLKELEQALCRLFSPEDLSTHAYTFDEWPAKMVLDAVLDNSADEEIGKLLETLPGTIHSLFGSPYIILRRVDELIELMNANIERFEAQALLRTWVNLAEIMKNYVRETDDINEGNLLQPEYPTTFGVLRQIFKIANRVNDEVDTCLMQQCCAAFGLLYAEAQTTVRHEFDEGAEIILRGVFEELILPETFFCCGIYVSAFTSAVDYYPFKLFNASFSVKPLTGSNVEFNALGEIAGLVEPMKVFIKSLIKLLDSAEGKLQKAVPGIFLAFVNVCERLFKEVTNPIMRLNLFISTSDLLNDMYPKFFGDDVRFRDVSQDALKSYVSILDLVRTLKGSCPFDDTVLAECEPLMAQLLGGVNGKRSKLRVAAAQLWNDTFAQAKSHTYSKEFRKVLSSLAQKRVIYVPGLSKKPMSSSDINEYKNIGDVESTSDSVSDRSDESPRKEKINGEALKDEDSTCSVSANTRMWKGAKRRTKHSQSPVGETPNKKAALEQMSSPKCLTAEVPTEEKDLKSGEKLRRSTPSRSGTPKTRRRNYVGLLEEDSVDYVPIVFSDSAKKMKLTDRQKEIFSEKRERMPFLDEDSLQSAVITNLPSEFDLDSSQSTSVKLVPTAPSAELKEESTTKYSSSVREMEKTTCDSECVQEKTVDVATNGDSLSGAVTRRKSKVKLNFDQMDTFESSPNDNDTSLRVHAVGVSPHPDLVEKMDCLPAKMVEPNLESKDSVESSGEASAELSAESDTDEIKKLENAKLSRRAQKKGTPSKYIARKRRSSIKSAEKREFLRSHKCSKVTLKTMKDAAHTGPVSEKHDEATEVRITADSGDEMQPLREIDDVLIPHESLDVSLDEKEKECEKSEVTEANDSPKEMPEDSEKVASAMTPSLMQRIAGTPGILKKANSPSTAEKKFRRVHFDNGLENAAEDSALLDLGDAKLSSVEEQFPASPKGALKTVTPRRPFAHLQTSEDKGSVFPPIASTSDSNASSPVKSDVDGDDQPIFAELMGCQESIGKIVGKLLPISTTTGAITLRKTLEARGIVQIGHFAAMTRREVSALNIKKPRVETTLKVLSQFARDHFPPPKSSLFKNEDVPETEHASRTLEGPQTVTLGKEMEQNTITLVDGEKPEERVAIVPETEDAREPSEEPEARVAMEQEMEQNAAAESAGGAVATADVAGEMLLVSSTRSAAEPEIMPSSSGSSVNHFQLDRLEPKEKFSHIEFDSYPSFLDPIEVYTKKLRKWRDTVLDANRDLALAMVDAEAAGGANREEIRSKRGLLMMITGCIEMINAKLD